MVDLSIIIVGRDQSLTLEAAIRSADGFPVLYVDTGSTDVSCDLAEGLGSSVIKTDVRGGGPTRNLAARQAKTTHCMFIAPDDVILPGFAEAWNVIQEKPEAATVNVSELKFPDRHRAQRIWRRDIQWKGRAHEFIDTSNVSHVDATIQHQRGPWHDKPSDPDGVIQCLQADIAEDFDNPRWWYYLAREYVYRREWDKAIPLLQKRIALHGWHPELADSHLLLSKCYWNSGRGEEARRECQNALMVNSNFVEAARWMAQIVFPEQAKPWLAMAGAATNDGVLFVR